MIKLIVSAFALSVILSSFASPPVRTLSIPALLPYIAASQTYTNTPKGILVLSEKNTLVLDTEVNEESITALEMKALEMSHKLSPEDHIILVLNTPGGEIQSGTEFIDFLHGLPQKVDTLTINSFSMGFITVQSQGLRMILPNGILMSHRAHGSGIPGDYNGSFEVHLKYIMDAMAALDTMCATRMGINLSSYRELTRDEYWVRGENAVKEGAADIVVLARCDESLSGVKDVMINTMFGLVKMKKSNCPLITGS